MVTTAQPYINYRFINDLFTKAILNSLEGLQNVIKSKEKHLGQKCQVMLLQRGNENDKSDYHLRALSEIQIKEILIQSLSYNPFHPYLMLIKDPER